MNVLQEFYLDAYQLIALPMYVPAVSQSYTNHFNHHLLIHPLPVSYSTFHSIYTHCTTFPLQKKNIDAIFNE